MRANSLLYEVTPIYMGGGSDSVRCHHLPKVSMCFHYLIYFYSFIYLLAYSFNVSFLSFNIFPSSFFGIH